MSVEPDDVLARVARIAGTGRSGERPGARVALQEIWDEVGPTGDPLHRCAVAHAMADLQDDPKQELAWDLLALEAADGITEDSVEESGVAISVAGLYPSLHLNLADVHRRLGMVESAHRHIALGRKALDVLGDGDDVYRQLIEVALDRVEHRIDEAMSE
jgi:hypothetical protein